ncbi:MAG: UDP-N-acetylglucosamine 1-carboxyvinyltransferase [Lentisphaerae bacterium]|nr:UDP-N-acetylglucosamine 1-carboxyvinyltransferase [Lentisphaerota bacterium]MCP4102592.1 UDP-N-acetylglucosamine 1-carboxyvinyltransferase [Lentisphaerota bacterium]
MQSLIIEGKAPIKGEVTVGGNKNAVLPMLAAALLTDEKIILHNVPEIVDVLVMLEIFDLTGVEYDFKNNTLTIEAKIVKESTISKEICSRIRTSILFAGPLAIRCGKCEIFPPGGDIIGRRRLDGHIYGLKSLGIDVELDHRFIFTAPKRLIGRELFLDEASVTATEQLMTAAVTAEGITTIRNAASEPHVSDLAELLNKMGAKISGLHSNTLIIEGVEKLHGAEHTVVSDHTEAGSFIALGAACGGELTIKNTVPRHYWMTRRVFERLGVKLELHPNEIYLPGQQELKIKKDFGGHCPVIADGPWPQFPSDLMSVSIVAATQAEGTILFFEKMFESRLYFVDRLISMGAGAIVCDPHRVVINGRSKLRGVEMSSPDIRAGMALLIASLCAHGQSKINSANIIYRGYERIVEKLLNINAKVKAIET